MAELIANIGNLVRLRGTYTDINGDLQDPTNVTIETEEPDTAYTLKTFGPDLEVIKESLGIFHLDFSPTQEGRHGYRWASTGTGQAAKEGTFLIQKQLVKP